MKSMMNSIPTTLVVALFAISHDGEGYTAGDLFEVPKTQASFLFMAKCVREPTSDEVEAWRDQQEMGNGTMATALNANESAQLAYPVDSAITAKHQYPKEDNSDVDDENHTEHANATDDAVVFGMDMASEKDISQTVTIELSANDDVATDASTDTNAIETATSEMATDVVVDDANGKADDAGVVIGATVDAPNVKTNPYDGWLKKDLNAELDKRGIEHDAHARNDELEKLLIADDTKQG